MFKIISSFLLLLLLLSACVEEDHPPPGSQLLMNHHISLTPDSVFPWTAVKSEGVELGVSKEIFFTGNQSLFIENTDSLYFNSGGSWTQNISGPMPAPGSRLELTAFLKGENIRNLTPTGSVFISFQILPWSDKGNNQGRFIMSDKFVLEGDFDWTILSITLDSFPEDAENINVSLVLPRVTTGKIYFDEITLTVI